MATEVKTDGVKVEQFQRKSPLVNGMWLNPNVNDAVTFAKWCGGRLTIDFQRDTYFVEVLDSDGYPEVDVRQGELLIKYSEGTDVDWQKVTREEYEANGWSSVDHEADVEIDED